MDHFFILCSKKHSFPDKFDLYLFFKKRKQNKQTKSNNTIEIREKQKDNKRKNEKS